MGVKILDKKSENGYRFYRPGLKMGIDFRGGVCK